VSAASKGLVLPYPLHRKRPRSSSNREYATKADLNADVGRVLARLDKLDGKLDRLLTARFGGGE